MMGVRRVDDQAAGMFAGGHEDLPLQIEVAADRLLDVRPGHRALDVGCGTGRAAIRLALAVGEGGSVVGIDHDAAMLRRAGELAGEAGVAGRIRLLLGDAEALPFPDGAFDRVRCARVLQHVAEPAAVAREMFRVLRPGGRMMLMESDHSGLSVDTGCAEIEWRIRRGRVALWPHGTAGRQIYGVCRALGLRDLTLLPGAVPVTSLASFERATDWTRSLRRLVETGRLSAQEEETIDSDLRARDERGNFFAYGVCIAVVGRKPLAGETLL